MPEFGRCAYPLPRDGHRGPGIAELSAGTQVTTLKRGDCKPVVSVPARPLVQQDQRNLPEPGWLYAGTAMGARHDSRTEAAPEYRVDHLQRAF
jgi:hypothetical protein